MRTRPSRSPVSARQIDVQPVVDGDERRRAGRAPGPCRAPRSRGRRRRAPPGSAGCGRGATSVTTTMPSASAAPSRRAARPIVVATWPRKARSSLADEPAARPPHGEEADRKSEAEEHGDGAEQRCREPGARAAARTGCATRGRGGSRGRSAGRARPRRSSRIERRSTTSEHQRRRSGPRRGGSRG